MSIVIGGGVAHVGLCRTVLGLDWHPPATAAASAICWEAFVEAAGDVVGDAPGFGLALPQAAMATALTKPTIIVDMSLFMAA